MQNATEYVEIYMDDAGLVSVPLRGIRDERSEQFTTTSPDNIKFPSPCGE
jgi:hypothetical protein